MRLQVDGPGSRARTDPQLASRAALWLPEVKVPRTINAYGPGMRLIEEPRRLQLRHTETAAELDGVFGFAAYRYRHLI